MSALDDLADGYGTAGAMAELAAGQLTRRRVLLMMLIQRAGDAVRAAADLIDRAEAADPAAVAEVLARPHLDAWATLCLYDLADGSPPTNLGHLAGYAVAAAMAAGIDYTLDVPVADDGFACVPGVGRAWGSGRFSSRVPHRGPDWQPLRTVELAPGFSVTIEDQDPYRNAYGMVPLGHLSEVRASHVAKLLEEAWHLIERDHPRHAETMRHSLRAIVPLATPESGMMVSASSHHACGAVAVSIPDTAAELALLLIHEHMHDKLDALLWLEDLHVPAPTGLYHAPWRLDPRPVDALLQGVYAHTGVTDFWRRQRHVADADRTRATAQFVYWHQMTSRAAVSLAGSGELTPTGKRFVSTLLNTLDSWNAESVPQDLQEDVILFVLGQTVRWRLLNCPPTDAEIDELTILEGSVTTGVEATAVTPGPARGPVDAPGILAYLHRWLAGTNTPLELDEAADRLAAGDPAGAARRYLERLERDPNDDDAWTGLAVCRRMLGDIADPVGLHPNLCRLAILRYGVSWLSLNRAGPTIEPRPDMRH